MEEMPAALNTGLAIPVAIENGLAYSDLFATNAGN